MLQITGYRLTVHRGARAGLVREYTPAQRTRARRFADRLDLEYGAICASVAPIMSEPVRTYRCTAAALDAEHESEVAFLTAQGFALASKQAAR